MRHRVARLIAVGVASFGLATTPINSVSADDRNGGVEVLARGPVHEAFAATLEYQTAAPIVPKAPPDQIEELPPDQKPAGDNVQWIPGYWHYDEEKTDFIWISGFWRQPPPGRVWVPGSWREARGGWQWAHGFWQLAQVENRVEYLPTPPVPLEFAPSVPSPSETHVYVPGTWVWLTNRYAWRPGVWVDHRPNWIWCPAHYRWTPAGYVFIDGYWDYPLADRGVLFAPVYLPPPLYNRPAFIYQPSFVVAEPSLYTSLFVRRGWGCYYFGDYFERRYLDVGFNAWCGNVRTSGFSVSVGFGRGFGYDPLWDHYRVSFRNDRTWIGGINDCYAGRFAGTVVRPPRTLVQQNVVINNITNVTNVTNVTNNINNNVINNNINNNINNVTMVTALKDVSNTNRRVTLQQLPPEQQAR
ncbi:MAG: hypothetical protein ACRCZF_00490, partial [Gemmataceae bacterium]